MQKTYLRVVWGSLFLVLSCGLPPAEHVARQTMVRVGLLQHQDSVAVMVPQNHLLRTPDGKTVHDKLPGGRWLLTFELREAAQFEYRLLIAAAKDRREAFEWLHRASDAGVLPEISEKKTAALPFAADEAAPASYQIFVRERFPTAEAARERQKQLDTRLSTEVIEYLSKPAKSILRVRNLDANQRLEVESGLQVQAERFTLPAVVVGDGFHWESKQSRSYRGALHVAIDRTGKLTMVNVLPIEAYLAGVVPSEMDGDFPAEALKAQAVAARTEVFFRLGSRHLDDGFDLCAEPHCQVYGGITRESENATRAVAATAGLVMKRDGRMVDAVYHAVCGGQTENNEDVWNGAPQPHLRAIFDGAGRPQALGNSLTQTDLVRRWIDSQPPVHCNVLTDDLPKSMDYARKYFRWETVITREALQAQISKSTGEIFGDLVDLAPLQRGHSGRIKRLQVVGTKKSFEISSELMIRRALSPSTLWSSCFVVEKEMLGAQAEKFIFRGAGWGHGVGMCQVGAGMMAWRGQSFAAILKHYYTGVTIAKASP
jgi:SpoIID/LytB domain protein